MTNETPQQENRRRVGAMAVGAIVGSCLGPIGMAAGAYIAQAISTGNKIRSEK